MDYGEWLTDENNIENEQIGSSNSSQERIL